MRTRKALALALVLLASCSAGTTQLQGTTSTGTVDRIGPNSDLGHEPNGTIAIRCEEDQPCWDCHTMGNLDCGPIASGEAQREAQARQNEVGPNYLCWAEVNAELPQGYEVLCRSASPR